MTPTLQSLQALGVRELSVKNQEATAVNPYDEFVNAKDYFKWIGVKALPPLHTYGIPDGTVLIEHVEEQWQVQEDGEWFSVAKGKALSLYTDLPNRCALVYKQVKEEEPKAETVKRNKLIEIANQIYDKPASVEPEGEQTAEGIEPIEFYMRAQKRFIVSSKYYVQPEKWELKAMQEYAASQLAQYKAKLIATFKALEKVDEGDGMITHYSGMQISKAIDLIQNS